VLAACGSNGAEKESFIVVNPANPQNIVATWFGGLALGTIAAVTLDGGTNWQQVIIPGATECTGGPPEFQHTADPWLAFAPNGDLYQSCIPYGSLTYRGPSGLLVSKSVDGGLHWTSQGLLDVVTDKQMTVEKPSITADPTDSRFVYAMWTEQFYGGNTNLRGRAVLRFARTTDGGATWEPARTIFDPGSNNQAWGGVVAVLPNGTLVATFIQFRFSNINGGWQKAGVLSVMRSTNHGETWSPPIQGPIIPSFETVDPENGFPIATLASFPANIAAVTVDPRTGNVYTAFEDNRASGGQFSSIYFMMYNDQLRQWSEPIPVNQTPTDIPASDRNAFLPSVAVADDGTIGVSYYDFRNNDSGPGLATDYWLVRCHPSATAPATDPANWSGEVRLTNSLFNLEGAASTQGYYFIGDYEGLTTAGNDFLAAWGQPHDTDLDSVFFRRAYGDSTLNDGSLIAAANLATPTSSGSAGQALDAYFMDLARTSQATSSVTNSDSTSWHSFGLATAALVVPPLTEVSDTPAFGLTRRPDHGPTLDWRDFLTLGDLSHDMEVAGWHAG
jgi:hypothetical protein